MASLRFPFIPAFSSSPLSAPHPPIAIPPPSSLPMVLFAVLVMALPIAAATKRDPLYPGISIRYGLAAWMSARIRLRLDPLRRISASSSKFPDPPQVSGHDPPVSSRQAHPFAGILCLLAWSDPDLVLKVLSQPKSLISGELLDAGRWVPPPNQTEMLRSHSRARQPSRPKNQANSRSRAGYLSQAALHCLAFKPSRASFWAQIVKPNWPPLGWCELFCRSRWVGAQFIGPPTYA